MFSWLLTEFQICKTAWHRVVKHLYSEQQQCVLHSITVPWWITEKPRQNKFHKIIIHQSNDWSLFRCLIKMWMRRKAMLLPEEHPAGRLHQNCRGRTSSAAQAGMVLCCSSWYSWPASRESIHLHNFKKKFNLFWPIPEFSIHDDMGQWYSHWLKW